MSKELCCRINTETRAKGSSNKRCKRFDTECPECLCEKFTFGNGSPSPVKPTETLVRFHFTPHDFDENGNLTPFAFTDVQELGLSLTRDGATDNEIERAISGRLSRMGDKDAWRSVSLVETWRVRDIFRKQQGNRPERAFCVYDTAEKHNRMHAEICQTKAGRKLRNDLRKLLAYPVKTHSYCM